MVASTTGTRPSDGIRAQCIKWDERDARYKQGLEMASNPRDSYLASKALKSCQLLSKSLALSRHVQSIWKVDIATYSSDAATRGS